MCYSFETLCLAATQIFKPVLVCGFLRLREGRKLYLSVRVISSRTAEPVLVFQLSERDVRLQTEIKEILILIKLWLDVFF